MRKAAEFWLTVECCRYSFAEAVPRRIASPPTGFDWTLFLKFVCYHRIEGLVWNCLASADFRIPDEIREELSTAALENAARNLRGIAECAELRDAFGAAGVTLLFLKGLTLGSLAYGRPELKSAVDIDLLIDPADLKAAAGLLGHRGYRVTVPASDQKLGRWHRRSRESVWARERPFSQIDLHTRLADNPLLIPEISVHSLSQTVELGSGQRLPTIATDELFTYLAVHGGTSSWFRLKWISDFAGLIQSKEPAEIERLYRRSQELGAGRAAAQGLLLADRLFGSLAENADLSDELQKDRATRRLVEISVALLSRPPREPTEHFLGTVPLHLAPFLLMPGWRYKISELAAQVSKLTGRFID